MWAASGAGHDGREIIEAGRKHASRFLLQPDAQPGECSVRPRDPSVLGGSDTASHGPSRDDPSPDDPSLLRDADLIQRVLGSPGDPTSPRVADALLARVGLTGLRDATEAHIASAIDVTPACAARLAASIELGRRVYGVVDSGPRFDGPEVVARHARDIVSDSREHFVVWLLNARHRILARELVSIGSLSASIVHPREVFRAAIAASAAAIVLAHNHPSGDPEPSRDDIEITRRLVRAGHLLGIPVLDHVILAGARYTSMRREGLVMFEWQGAASRSG